MPDLPAEWDLRGFSATLAAERVLLKHRAQISPAVLEEIKKTSRAHGDFEQGSFLILERHVVNTLARILGAGAL